MRRRHYNYGFKMKRVWWAEWEQLIPNYLGGVSVEFNRTNDAAVIQGRPRTPRVLHRRHGLTLCV
jgi:hypothetical protein